MSKLQKLRQERAQINDRTKKILTFVDMEVEKRPGRMTDEQISLEVDENETKIAELDKQIKDAEAWEERRTRASERDSEYNQSAGTPVPTTGSNNSTNSQATGTEERSTGLVSVGNPVSNKAPGMTLARIVRALAACGGNVRQAAKFAGGTFGDREAQVALEAGNFEGAGFIIPPNYVAELIDLLRPVSTVMSMGVTEAPLVNGSLTLPKLTGGASAEYIGESTNIPISTLTGGQVTAKARKCVSMVPYSNDLVRYASPAADLMIRNDMVRAVGQRRDQAYIRDDGTGNAPRGLRYWVPSGNILTMTATPNLQKTDYDLGRMIQALLTNNVVSIPRSSGQLQANSSAVVTTSIGWLITPRTWMYLSTLRTSNGEKAYPEVDRGMLKMFPYAVTNQVPENLNTNETEIYLAVFSDIVVAQASSLEVDVSSTAAYHDGTAVRAAYSLDQSVIRMILNDDLITRHREAIVVMTGVTWGTTA